MRTSARSCAPLCQAVVPVGDGLGVHAFPGGAGAELPRRQDLRGTGHGGVERGAGGGVVARGCRGVLGGGDRVALVHVPGGEHQLQARAALPE